jgi:hypothetical protein
VHSQNTAQRFRALRFSADGDHDSLDETFVAALGTAAQIVQIRMAINKRLASFPKNVLQRFWDDYVWTPNNGDWQRLRGHNSDVELSSEHFQMFTEK